MTGTIFRSSLILALGGALALALSTATIVLFSPVPFDFPLSTYEIARSLRNEPIARSDAHLERSITPTPPVGSLPDATSEALRLAIARQLGVDQTRVALAFDDGESWLAARRMDPARTEYERVMIQSIALYRGDTRYAPLIFRPFRAALRQPDGRWLTVSRLGTPPGPQLQWGLLRWLGFAALLIVPLAWIFSQRLSRPIRAFAQAADRIGSGSFERIEARGPVEIRIATAALNEMQARIERYVNERTSMVGAIAHDLRTPLARLSFLLADAPPNLRTRIDAEIAGMERMIGVTLDYVQSETTAVQREPVDLRSVVESVIDDRADMAGDAILDPGPPVTVMGDAILLTRLFANIVDNALAYGTSARAQISVEGGNAVVVIDDDGPGLSNADLARVFEPFYRGEKSRNTKTGGIGLGMSIVHTLVHSHGGNIVLTNIEPGLRVRVALPTAVDRKSE